MSGIKPAHAAAQSAAGYLYQARLALAECLRFAYAEPDIEVAIERLDDVSFEKDGDPLELLQTKHHLSKSGDLTDGSVDLWKTLGIWSEHTKSDPSLPSRTRFILVTTAQAPQGSAASFLRPLLAQLGGRDVSQAVALLIEAAAQSKNSALEKATSAFSSLTPAMQRELVAAIEVLDGSPLVADIGSLIEERLKMIAPRAKIALAREQLEGWWWPRICSALQAQPPSSIAVLDVEMKLDDIRDSLKRDALPLDMEHVDPSDDELGAFEEMRFVSQLRAVGIGANRIQFAKRDFYRASVQRSRWARQNLLLDGEVGRFERTLIEEWQPRFSEMCDGLPVDCDGGALRQAGQDLYYWVETEARFQFRTVTSRFLNVGSYHMLADDLRIGWHRDYQALHGVDGEQSSDGD